MNNTAFLFPGQGGLGYVGIGKDIYDKYEDARSIYDKASDILNIDIADLCFNKADEELNNTSSAQIVILVTSLAILEVIRNKKINANMTAGLSLGEYTACIYSGMIDLEEGIKLVRKRGEYMQRLKPEGAWQMAAVLGLKNNVVEEICEKVSKEIGFVTPANYNYPRSDSDIR